MIVIREDEETRYDVAASNGQVIGWDVSAELKNLIIGCLDGGPPLVRVHRPGGQRTAAWAVQMAARCNN
jgi:hypothetical protein